MDAKNFPAIDTIWDYDQPQITELKFRELLPAAERSGNQSYYTELLTQLARTLSLQRKFDDAHEILNKAAQLIGAQDMPVAEIRYLLERGRAFNSADEKQKAITLILFRIRCISFSEIKIGLAGWLSSVILLIDKMNPPADRAHSPFKVIFPFVGGRIETLFQKIRDPYFITTVRINPQFNFIIYIIIAPNPFQVIVNVYCVFSVFNQIPRAGE